jgi:uncharacterized protein (DUF302 family)
MVNDHTDQMSAPRGVITRTTSRTVDQTVTRLSELIAARGLKQFAVIDQRAEAESSGLALRETRLMIFGSPAAGTAVMDAAPLAALDLPLKILIWADQGQTMVSYVDPDELALRYDLDGELAARLTGIRALVSAVAAE